MGRVIIADDDRLWSEVFCELVRIQYPDVYAERVESGDELVRRVLSGSYDLAITDCRMERADAGLEAIEAIRRYDSRVPLYMISASNRGERALELGATGVLEKPVDWDTLYCTLDKYLRSR